MYQQVPIQKLSHAQILKLLKGERIRVKHGAHHTIHASKEQHKKIMSAHKKGKGCCIQLDPYQQGMPEHLMLNTKKGKGWLTDTLKEVAKEAAPHIIDWAGKKAKKYVEGMGGEGLAFAEHAVKTKRPSRVPKKRGRKPKRGGDAFTDFFSSKNVLAPLFTPEGAKRAAESVKQSFRPVDFKQVGNYAKEVFSPEGASYFAQAYAPNVLMAATNSKTAKKYANPRAVRGRGSKGIHLKSKDESSTHMHSVSPCSGEGAGGDFFKQGVDYYSNKWSPSASASSVPAQVQYLIKNSPSYKATKQPAASGKSARRGGKGGGALYPAGYDDKKGSGKKKRGRPSKKGKGVIGALLGDVLGGVIGNAAGGEKGKKIGSTLGALGGEFLPF